MKRTVLIAAVFFLYCGTGVGEQFQEKVKKPVNDAISIRQKTQAKEDQWAGERQKLTAMYETLEIEREQLQAKKSALESEVESYRKTVAGLSTQLASIEQISSQLAPFLGRTVAQLSDGIRDDLPFLIKERTERMTLLNRLLDEHDVSMGEKFRKVMEALFIEADYGNTIEVYQGKIEIENRTLLANIFRLGRLALFCQSPDRKNVGFWDPANNAWQPLPAKYHRDIQLAMEMGNKRRPVDMLSLPLGKVVVK